MIAGATYGIYRSTPDGRILEANPALATMLGYESVEALYAVNLSRDVYAEAGARDRLLAACRQHRDVTGEERWTGKDGRQLTVCVSAHLAVDIDGTEVFDSVVEDITARRALETQLRASQKLETIGRLAGGIAHDFNNLLTAILGYSELLLEGDMGRSPQRGDLEEIRAAAGRAAALTAQLLAFSRRQMLAPKVVDVSAAVTSLVPMLRRLIGEDIVVVIRADEPDTCVNADPSQLDQVLVNLTVNARDTTPPGGALTIDVEPVDVTRAGGPIPPGRYVRLRVRDTGSGMDPATKAHMFEPFFTTKGPGRGTGLGLATVYGIVMQSIRGTGTASSSCRLSTVVRCAFCTSTVGDSPVTVTDSSTAPTRNSPFTVAVKLEGRSIPLCTKVLNPWRVNVTR